ncbi:MAG: glycosyltransferase [Acholeplasmataceae bacterium]|nr:glycosyltransferase [Acholeplasmataceae bacterium]
MIKLAISIGTLQIGGAEIFVVNLLKHLDYSRYKVLLVVLSKKYDTYLEKEIARLPIEIVFMDKPEGFRPRIMCRIYRILKVFKPDLLHGNIGGLIYFLPYLIFHRLKMIHTVHTLANIEFKGVKRRIIYYCYRKKKIIPVATSRAVLESIRKLYKLEEVILIPNGIDVKRFRCQRDYLYKKVTIGHVGRFEAVKNHQTIIKTFFLLRLTNPNLRLRLVGNGSLYSYYKDLLENEKDVEMVGASPQVFEELRGIDIFLFPSRYEGMPLALLEAMASGCVIVASKIGGIVDLVEPGENGVLIDDCDDAEAFARAIKDLLKDKEKMKAISQNNQRKAEDFDLIKMQGSYQKLYFTEVRDVKRRI